MTEPSAPLRWHNNLPLRFVDLCHRLEIASSEQAWVLALGLRDTPKAFNEPPFEPSEIEEVVRKLTPVQRTAVETGYFVPMPIVGAIDPSTVANVPTDAPAQTASDQPAEDSDDA